VAALWPKESRRRECRKRGNVGLTGYAATAIDGKLIKNGTLSGKKLKQNTRGRRQ
jgi:hypothetical protein